MTEPPKPREGVLPRFIEWIQWWRSRPQDSPPQPFRAAPPAAAADPETGANGWPLIDHRGAI